jgi:DNA-binding NtrC family response regulator
VVDDPEGLESTPAGAGLARLLAGAMPALVEQRMVSRPGRVSQDVLVMLERPLLVHVLALTGGNQLKASRLLGVNRNTLRKRCRELHLPLPRAARTMPPPAAISPAAGRRER